MQRKGYALIAAMILAASVASPLHALYLIDADNDDSQETTAICSTDTDCMRFCPPPADDPECDGGPQS